MTGLRLQAPGLRARPGTRNQEPGTRNQEPRTKNQEPRTKNQEPRTKNKAGCVLESDGGIAGNALIALAPNGQAADRPLDATQSSGVAKHLPCESESDARISALSAESPLFRYKGRALMQLTGRYLGEGRPAPRPLCGSMDAT
jgi:hypothetical protein